MSDTHEHFSPETIFNRVFDPTIDKLRVDTELSFSGTVIAASDVNVHDGLGNRVDSTDNSLNVWENEVITEKTATQDLSAGSLSLTTTVGSDFELNHITGHVTTSISGTVTVTLDAAAGSSYDTILFQSTGTFQNVFYQPDESLVLKSGNEVIVSVVALGAPSATVAVRISTNKR